MAPQVLFSRYKVAKIETELAHTWGRLIPQYIS